MTSAELTEVFRAAFPIRAGVASLEFVEVLEHEDREPDVVVRLIVWEARGDMASIRDVKEQALYLRVAVTSERLAAYLGGLERVLTQVLAGIGPGIDTLMPHDLIDFSVLKLKSPATIDDFDKALRAKSRLGKYLPPA